MTDYWYLEIALSVCLATLWMYKKMEVYDPIPKALFSGLLWPVFVPLATAFLIFCGLHIWYQEYQDRQDLLRGDDDPDNHTPYRLNCILL